MVQHVKYTYRYGQCIFDIMFYCFLLQQTIQIIEVRYTMKLNSFLLNMKKLNVIYH